jgi:hypothetical protein
MLSTIGFDNQPVLMAVEVQNVWSVLMLATELRPRDLPVAQELPEQVLGIGTRPAELATAFEKGNSGLVTMIGSGHTFTLTLTLSQGERE